MKKEVVARWEKLLEVGGCEKYYQMQRDDLSRFKREIETKKSPSAKVSSSRSNTPKKARIVEVSSPNPSSSEKPSKEGLKNLVPKPIKYEFDYSTEEAYLQSILDFNENNAYFPFGQLWEILRTSGWCKIVVPKHVNVNPKFSTSYFPFWSVNREDMKEGESFFSVKSSQIRSHSGGSTPNDFLEGRDYFYEHKHIVDYLKQFGNEYHEKGLSDQFITEEGGRGGKRMSKLRVCDQLMSQSSSSDRLSYAPSKRVLSKEEKVQLWRENLVAQGFIFDEGEDLFVGKRLRRFFTSQWCDATCVAYRRETFDTPAQYGVIHDDMDTEVLNLQDVSRASNDFVSERKMSMFDYVSKDGPAKKKDEQKQKALQHELKDKIKEQERLHREAMRKAISKAVEETREQEQKHHREAISKFKDEMRSMREKHRDQRETLKDQEKKRGVDRKQLEQVIDGLRLDLQQQRHVIRTLNDDLSHQRQRQQLELEQQRKANNELLIKTRMDMEALSRSLSRDSSAEAPTNVSDGLIKGAEIIDRSKFISRSDAASLAAWQEYVKELSSGEKSTERHQITITRNIEEISLRSSVEQSYPVLVTVNLFSKWTTKKQLTAPLRVTFQHAEKFDGRKTGKQRLVQVVWLLFSSLFPISSIFTNTHAYT